MNTIREIQQINQQELERGLAGTAGSWHSKYANSPWIYVGNLDHGLSEGDVLCVLSQFGELEDIHLVRDDDTGKSRGFAFLKYEDARSCVLAVDNFCGVTVCGRSLRVDHVEHYRLPKHLMEREEKQAAKEAAAIRTEPGRAYEGKELANEYNLKRGHDLFAPTPPQQQNKEETTGEDSGKDVADPLLSKRERKEERARRRERKEQRQELRRMKRAKRMMKKNEDGGGEVSHSRIGVDYSDRKDEGSRRKKKKKKKRA